MKKVIILVTALFMILLLNNLTNAQQWEYYPRNNNYYNSWNRSQQYSLPRFSSPYQQNYSQQRPSSNSFDPYYFQRWQFEQKMQKMEESRKRTNDYIFFRSLLK